jgi:HAD superfamily hydrolase (TIGR01549 family)
MIKLISFDLDGTLVDRNFDDLLWYKVVPGLFAKKHNVSFDKALKKCTSEYDKLGDKDRRWYSIQHWFDYFKLDDDWKKVIWELKGEIGIYPETISVLTRLSKRYKLVLLSNCAREFLDVKVEVEGLKNHFSEIFSVTSDFNDVKKGPEIYLEICKRLNVKPSEVIHVGDHKDFDFEVPRKVGITAFLIDRKGKEKGKFVVADLIEFEKSLGFLQLP